MSPALAGRFFTTSTAWEAQRKGQKNVKGPPSGGNSATKAQERERMPRRAVAHDVWNVVSHQEVAGIKLG